MQCKQTIRSFIVFLSGMLLSISSAHAALDRFEPKKQICQGIRQQIYFLDESSWDESCLAGDFVIKPVAYNEPNFKFLYWGLAPLQNGAKKGVFCAGTVYQETPVDVDATCN